MWNKVNYLGKSLKKKYCTDAINQNVNNLKKIWSTIKKLSENLEKKFNVMQF